MKKLFLPLIAVALVFTLVVTPYQGGASSQLDKINRELAELEKKRKAAEQAKKNAQSQINKIQKDRKRAKEEIVYLQTEIDRVSNEIIEYEGQIEDKSNEVKVTAEELDAAEKRVAVRDELIKSRLRIMYMNGAVSYLDVLLSSASFTDFLDRFEALTSIIGKDKDILIEHRNDRDLVAQKKIYLEKQLNELKYMYGRLEEKKDRLIKDEKNKEVMIASLNEKEEHLEHSTEEQERVLMEIAAESSKLLRERNKLTVTTYDGSQMQWPLPQAYRISSNFGYRTDPITGKKGAYHKGTDIAAPGGTNILAAEQGIVIVAGWYGGYGNAVIIDHLNGLWTLYGHMRKVSVSKGDTVARGSKIGEVGTTGQSTGNHLHFEVRKNGEPTNPMNYVKQP